jgi:hypothetical protein
VPLYKYTYYVSHSYMTLDRFPGEKLPPLICNGTSFMLRSQRHIQNLLDFYANYELETFIALQKKNTKLWLMSSDKGIKLDGKRFDNILKALTR